ncbi:hypothetical protein ACQY0O_007410 [Thecaphora frezii]
MPRRNPSRPRGGSRPGFGSEHSAPHHSNPCLAACRSLPPPPPPPPCPIKHFALPLGRDILLATEGQQTAHRTNALRRPLRCGVRLAPRLRLSASTTPPPLPS